jgi:hypothetical protein
LPTVEGQPDHRFVLALRTGLFRGDDDPAATSVVNALISTAATHPGLYHAHVEIGNEYEAQGGLYYAGVTAIPFPPWYRCLNDAVWWNPRTDRQRLVRGVYWGTYLSPDMARRFDPDGKTAEAFLSYKDHPNFEHSQYIIRLENGGMFIALTGNPLHMCDQPNSVADLSLGLAAWLQHTLRERQMLA